jgi:hypothetical protein
MQQKPLKILRFKLSKKPLRESKKILLKLKLLQKRLRK